MKKYLAPLTLIFIFNLVSTASAGPFADVPPEHWSYTAVKKLTQEGIINPNNIRTINDDKTVTRYQMAQYVAMSIEYSEKAGHDGKKLIKKLAAEFSSELKNLGVNVPSSELEVENLGADVPSSEPKVENVTFDGRAQFRYDNLKFGENTSTAKSYSYLELYTHYKINDDWTVTSQLQSNKWINGSSRNEIARLWLSGPAFGGTLSVGKLYAWYGYGGIIDDAMNGIKYQFGNTVKVSVFAGTRGGVTPNLGTPVDNKLSPYVAGSPKSDGSTESIGSSNYQVVAAEFPVSSKTNIKLAYHRVKLANGTYLYYKNNDPIALSNKSVSYLDGGFDTQLGNDVSLLVNVTKSNLKLDGYSNKGFYAKLQYKAADPQKTGSWDVNYSYRNISSLSEINSTWEYSQGVKGHQFMYEYVPMKNTTLSLWYLDGNIIGDGTKLQLFRARAEVLF